MIQVKIPAAQFNSTPTNGGMRQIALSTVPASTAVHRVTAQIVAGNTPPVVKSLVISNFPGSFAIADMGAGCLSFNSCPVGDGLEAVAWPASIDADHAVLVTID